MKKTKGFRSKTRHKLRKKPRERGLPQITKALQEFKIGNNVTFVIEPSLHKGQVHPRFIGKTGKIAEKRGRAYLVEFKNGRITKRVTVLPEHLRPV